MMRSGRTHAHSLLSPHRCRAEMDTAVACRKNSCAQKGRQYLPSTVSTHLPS